MKRSPALYLLCVTWPVIMMGCGSSADPATGAQTVTYAGQTVTSYCKMFGGMPGPTCTQVDEFRVDASGNANHTMTCTPFDGSASVPTVKLWSLDANRFVAFKKSLVEDNLFPLASDYSCDGGANPCNVSTDGPSYTITLTVDGAQKTIAVATSNIPGNLQSAVATMCGPPDEPN